MSDLHDDTALRLISEQRTAQLIGVSAAMLIAGRFRKAPILPFVRVGKRAIRYRLTDIREFIERNTVSDERSSPLRSSQLSARELSGSRDKVRPVLRK